MPAAVFDTNAVSDLMRDHPNVKARVGKHTDAIVTSVIVVGEIHYGLERLPTGKKRTDLETRAQKTLAALRIDPVTDVIADTYGRLKASLESQGMNFDDNDLWIAATAITLGGVFVTRDKPLHRIAGLSVEDWSV